MSVHIVNYAGHDYTDAEHWGELRQIVEGYVRPDRVDRLLFQVAEYVATQTKAEDWLLPSGLLLLNIFAVLCWMQHHGSVKILLWDKKYAHDPTSEGRAYREVHVTPRHIESLLKHFARETA